MLDRIRPRAVLVTAWAALLAGLGPAAPAAAVVLGGPAASASPFPSSSASPVAQAVGGPQLASRGTERDG